MLAAHHLAKSFRGRSVVVDVSLFLRRGEAVGLLGPNGAGKTTTFSMLIGVTQADSGQILLDRADITNMQMYERARRGMSYLPQEPSIFRGLTVEQNILLVLETCEPEAHRRRQILDELLYQFDLERNRKSLASTLSGGQRRRCEIARMLANSPSFILLDEPFAGVDPIAVHDIRAVVQFLKSQGIGVLITDHNVRETLGLVDRAYIIESGRMLMHGDAAAIVNDPEVQRIYLGEGFRL